MAFRIPDMSYGEVGLRDHRVNDQEYGTSMTFHPFKFERRRSRIDWRLLQGVDINSIVSALARHLSLHASPHLAPIRAHTLQSVHRCRKGKHRLACVHISGGI
jgi:hypothetical protein